MTAVRNAASETVWDTAWRRLALPTGFAAPALQPVGSHPEGASYYGALDYKVGGASEWGAD